MKRAKFPRGIVVILGIFAVVAAGLSLSLATVSATQPSSSRELGTAVAPQLAPGQTYENAALGYRITVPAGYRRAVSKIDGDAGEDAFTARSAVEDAVLCVKERDSRLRSPERQADVRVIVYPNPEGTSALAFASTPNRRLPFSRVESVPLKNGLEAARVVFEPDGATASIVIRANGRLYEVHPFVLARPSSQPTGWLDQLAASFEPIPPLRSSTPSSSDTLCTG